nr:protein PRRC2A-like [Anolis sagrei ordinatus]
MGKYLVLCSIVMLFVLLQTEVIMSLSRRGSSRPSGGNRGSHHKPSRPVHQPSKPSRPVHQPSKPSRPVHQPSYPGNPVHKPIKPVQNPVKPVQEVPVQSARQPVQPVQNPVVPQNKPANNPPPYNPAYQPNNPANPAQNPVVPQNKPANNPPPYNPAYPPHNPANPAQNPAYPPHNPANPAQNPAYPPHNPANPAYPPHNPANPAQNPAYPPHYPANPAQNPAYPPHNPANPAYPPHNPANPAYPPHNPVNPAQNPAYPPHNPANPAYPPQNPANPAQNPAYPPHNPGYPQHNPAYPPPNPGYPHNPNYPQNPSYPHYNPGYPHNPNYNPKWGHYDAKPWKPKPPKTNLKHIAGAAAVGALGGFVLSHAMSNMHFNFRNREEQRWWYENRNRYSDQVYYPKYEQPVPPEVFVRDCWNITVREFIEPTGNDTADEMERRVVTQVVHEMCVQQYRSYSGQAEGGSVIHNTHIQEPNPSNPVMERTQGGAVAGTAVGNTELSLGGPMGDMHFQFNDSEEQQWWNDNRHRFMGRVFQPNYSQPVPADVFVSDCVNATMGEYTKPSGNETANETETRVLKRLVPEMCMELYHNYSRQSEKEMVYNSDKKLEESIVPVKLAIKDMTTKHPTENNGGRNGAMSMHFPFADALLLPSMLLATVLSTGFLIP